ncbi:MAG: GNAT family N-acetyltransferase [Bacteroidetes bacterium]|nr:GNAT family N-acetyltransferase [Bacteroidota bacterium]
MEQLNDSDLRLLYSVSGNEINIDRYNYLRQLLTGSSSNCYIVKNINGDICGYCAMWFGEGLYDQIFGRIKNLNINDNGYLFRDYTFKKFRGKGVQKFMIYSRLEILRNNGYKTATTRIAIGNYISERVYKKFGFIGNLIEIRFPLLNAFYTMSNLVLLIPID